MAKDFQWVRGPAWKAALKLLKWLGEGGSLNNLWWTGGMILDELNILPPSCEVDIIQVDVQELSLIKERIKKFAETSMVIVAGS